MGGGTPPSDQDSLDQHLYNKARKEEPMTERWYSKKYKCQKCDNMLALADFWYSGSGKIKLQFVCPTCGMEFEEEPFMDSLKYDAIRLDFGQQDEVKQEPTVRKDGKPLKPPLQGKGPKPTITVRDYQYLHEINKAFRDKEKKP